MIEGWTNLDKDETSFPYADICNEAVSDNKVFDKFKKDSRYIAILEHVSPEQGLKYIEGIQQYDLNQDLIESFKENDLYGGSSKVRYDLPFGTISPSTLRYMQNALDISHFYSEGELNRIVEIGGGYGGLCKTISCLCDFEEYHIYDIEPAAKLQEKYLSKFDINGKIIHHSTIEKLEDIDLVVSNYAYSELNEELQSSYYENIISNAKKVYMILNTGQVSRQVFLNRAEKDFDINVEKVLDFWPPNGYLYYTTMTRK